MKMIIAVALALVAVAAAAPAAPGEFKIVEILRSSFVQNPDGSYDHAFESEDGIKKQETGELKEALDEDNKPHTVVVVRGAYSYPGEDGKPIEITYYADENGYHAEGASIPKQNPQRR